MLSSLWTWLSPSAAPSNHTDAHSPSQHAPHATSASASHADSTYPRQEGDAGDAVPASTRKNRKKRLQRKKKKAAHHHSADEDEQEEEREPDEQLWDDDAHDDRRRRTAQGGASRQASQRRKGRRRPLAHGAQPGSDNTSGDDIEAYPDADEDSAYLDEIVAAAAAAEAAAQAQATAAASAAAAAQGSNPTTPSTSTPGSSLAPASVSAPAADPSALASGAGSVPPESLAVDDLVASMLAQGKTHPGPSGPLQRVHNLPEGAGQAPGLPHVRSTRESRRKAEEHGLVPITDETGTLRVGFRIREDIVLMHPKDLKGEPVLLRM